MKKAQPTISEKEKQVTVFNVRLGFTTNSSSSHGFVVALPGSLSEVHYDCDDQSFQWEPFVTSRAEHKLGYLAQLLVAALSPRLPWWGVEQVVEKLVGVVPFRSQYHNDGDCQIDHESCLWLPRDWKRPFPDERFVRHFRKFLERDDVYIVGGNDNGGQVGIGEFQLPLGDDAHDVSDMACRYDEAYGYWTLFDRTNGAKIRMTFPRKHPQDGRKDIPWCASVPELLDIKLTNRCERGCSFCYQDSSPDSSENLRDQYKIWDLAQTLAEQRVFEVALGGGEPTLVRDFPEIPGIFRRYGVIPSFSTRSLAWIRKNSADTGKIYRNIGAFGYSVQSAADALELLQHLKETRWEKLRDKLTLQVPMGTLSRETYSELLELCGQEGLPLLLLGYKRVGRAAAEVPWPYVDWWWRDYKGLDWNKSPKLRIDTVLAAQSSRQLSDAGVPRWLYDEEDGRYSGYLDLTTERVGLSSYAPAEQLRAIPRLTGGHKRGKPDWTAALQLWYEMGLERERGTTEG